MAEVEAMLDQASSIDGEVYWITYEDGSDAYCRRRRFSLDAETRQTTLGAS